MNPLKAGHAPLTASKVGGCPKCCRLAILAATWRGYFSSSRTTIGRKIVENWSPGAETLTSSNQ